MKRVDICVLVLALFLVFAAPRFAQEKADVLVMKNGDRLTCEIKELEAGVLFVKLDYAEGTISVQWSEVARLESSRLFIIKTQNGSVYTGRLSTTNTLGDQPARIQIAETSQKKVEIERSEIVDITRPSRNLWQRFNVDLSSGILYSKGNESTQYNVSSLIEYPRDRWSAQVKINSALSVSRGADATTRNQLDLKANRLLRWDNYFYSGVTSFLQSSEQGIDRQTSFGGGIGRYLKNTNRAKISLLGGLAWQHTKYNETAPTTSSSQNVTSGMIAADVKVFKFKKTRLNLAGVLFPAISEPGRVYFRTDGSYYVKLVSNLSWNFSFYGSWDNRPPGRLSGSDYGTSSGLSWTFGNR